MRNGWKQTGMSVTPWLTSWMTWDGTRTSNDLTMLKYKYMWFITPKFSPLTELKGWGVLVVVQPLGPSYLQFWLDSAGTFRFPYDPHHPEIFEVVKEEAQGLAHGRVNVDQAQMEQVICHEHVCSFFWTILSWKVRITCWGIGPQLSLIKNNLRQYIKSVVAYCRRKGNEKLVKRLVNIPLPILCKHVIPYTTERKCL